MRCGMQDAKDASITHAVVGSKTEAMPAAGGSSFPAAATKVVRSEWLEASLSQGKRVPEGPYLVHAPAAASAGAGVPAELQQMCSIVSFWMRAVSLLRLCIPSAHAVGPRAHPCISKMQQC